MWTSLYVRLKNRFCTLSSFMLLQGILTTVPVIQESKVFHECAISTAPATFQGNEKPKDNVDQGNMEIQKTDLNAKS